MTTRRLNTTAKPVRFQGYLIEYARHVLNQTGLWYSILATIIAFFFAVVPQHVFAQDSGKSISLEYCYEQIEVSYPITQKFEIQKKITELNDRIARSGLFPEVQLSASASYQSDVTKVPFAANVPELSKDHYNVSVDVTQPIYDGGRIRVMQKLEIGQSAVEDAGVKTELWNVRGQTEQVYFGILFLQKQSETINVLIKDLEEQLESVQAKIDNGVLLPGNGLVLEAELLKVQQQNIRVRYDLEAAYAVLSELIGEEITPDTELEIPSVLATDFIPQEISRPELELFSVQTNTLNLQQELTLSDKLPKVSAFAKTAYGRPGLDVFENDLQTFWIVGLKAQWSLKSWINSGKKEEVLELQKRKIRADKETFRLGVKNELSTSEKKIEQLREQIELDEKVLELREQVVEETKNRLEQGVITSTEYITELNAESQARLNLEIRRVQLIQSIIQYSTKKGISWN